METMKIGTQRTRLQHIIIVIVVFIMQAKKILDIKEKQRNEAES